MTAMSNCDEGPEKRIGFFFSHTDSENTEEGLQSESITSGNNISAKCRSRVLYDVSYHTPKTTRPQGYTFSITKTNI